ncbi:hypothetical protein BH18ACT3_BH18ACT3_16550 [soil metagenome]
MKPWSYSHTTKAAYTTRHVRLESACSVELADRPETGDLVLARVTELGQHYRLELPDGRRATLYEGDEIVVASATVMRRISSRPSSPTTSGNAISSPGAGSPPRR